MVRPSILCPVDFSEPSRGALRFAAIIAEHFFGSLTVMTVDDPLLSGAAAATYGMGTYEGQTEQELEHFVKETFKGHTPTIAELRFEVAVGKPAIEIHRFAVDHRVHVIVMSTHGRTGAAKLVFGSTTERVLRETTVPMLVTPAGDPGPTTLEDVKRGLGGILAPVDLSPFSRHQVVIAGGLAAALGVPLTMLHVLEPLFLFPGHDAIVRKAAQDLRHAATHQLRELAAAVTDVKVEVVIAEGDPADEIARTVSQNRIGVIVVGLHAPSGFGPRMGSVTYRVLTRTRVPVLALPPTMRAAGTDSTSRAVKSEGLIVR